MPGGPQAVVNSAVQAAPRASAGAGAAGSRRAERGPARRQLSAGEDEDAGTRLLACDQGCEDPQITTRPVSALNPQLSGPDRDFALVLPPRAWRPCRPRPATWRRSPPAPRLPISIRSSRSCRPVRLDLGVVSDDEGRGSQRHDHHFSGEPSRRPGLGQAQGVRRQQQGTAGLGPDRTGQAPGRRRVAAGVSGRGRRHDLGLPKDRAVIKRLFTSDRGAVPGDHASRLRLPAPWLRW